MPRRAAQNDKWFVLVTVAAVVIAAILIKRLLIPAGFFDRYTGARRLLDAIPRFHLSHPEYWRYGAIGAVVLIMLWIFGAFGRR